jgi:lia operon protein LiaG
MKTLKITFTVLLIIISTGVISAQEYKIAFPNSKEGRLILNDFSDSLPIVGYNGNEIIITANSGDFAPPAKAKGLKPIFPAGTDNTGIGLDVERTENTVTVTCLLPFSKSGEYRIKVPDNLVIELTSGCERSNNVSITGMKNELDIKTCHDIDLKDITGPLVLSTISGDINITYSVVNTSKASSIQSISGDVDITLPVKTAVDLEFKTISGAFYSDFDFSTPQKNLKKVGGNITNYQLNSGGSKYSVGSISGNVYLRKGK